MLVEARDLEAFRWMGPPADVRMPGEDYSCHLETGDWTVFRGGRLIQVLDDDGFAAEYPTPKEDVFAKIGLYAAIAVCSVLAGHGLSWLMNRLSAAVSRRHPGETHPRGA